MKLAMRYLHTVLQVTIALASKTLKPLSFATLSKNFGGEFEDIGRSCSASLVFHGLQSSALGKGQKPGVGESFSSSLLAFHYMTFTILHPCATYTHCIQGQEAAREVWKADNIPSRSIHIGFVIEGFGAEARQAGAYTLTMKLNVGDASREVLPKIPGLCQVPRMRRRTLSYNKPMSGNLTLSHFDLTMKCSLSTSLLSMPSRQLCSRLCLSTMETRRSVIVHVQGLDSRRPTGSRSLFSTGINSRWVWRRMCIRQVGR